MRQAGSYIKDKNKKPVAGKDTAPRPKTDAEDVAAKRAAQAKQQEVSHAVSEK